MPNKLIPKDIDIITRQTVIYEIIDMIDQNKISFKEYEPGHSKDLWSKEKQDQFIESLLLRIPVPALYLVNIEDKYYVLDGLERLKSIRDLICHPEDKSSAFLNFQYLTELNGMRFDELPRRYKRRITEYILTTHCIRTGSPKEVVDNIYRRIH